jgi:hypothetical protein
MLLPFWKRSLLWVIWVISIINRAEKENEKIIRIIGKMAHTTHTFPIAKQLIGLLRISYIEINWCRFRSARASILQRIFSYFLKKGGIYFAHYLLHGAT